MSERGDVRPIFQGGLPGILPDYHTRYTSREGDVRHIVQGGLPGISQDYFTRYTPGRDLRHVVRGGLPGISPDYFTRYTPRESKNHARHGIERADRAECYPARSGHSAICVTFMLQLLWLDPLFWYSREIPGNFFPGLFFDPPFQGSPRNTLS